MTPDKPGDELLHPFLKIMKRYCIDYTNSHDTSILPEIMSDDYIVDICGQKLERSSSYVKGVSDLFSVAPGLGLTVHAFYCNGDRLAMQFSEHARFTDKNNNLAAWRGFSTYTWDENRLTYCWVEQDFYTRYKQVKSGIPQKVGSPAIDPWMTPIVPEDKQALAAGEAWLKKFDLSTVKFQRIDDEDMRPNWQLHVRPDEVIINDVFSAGNKVPFHITLKGALTTDTSKKAKMNVCGVLTINAEHQVESIEAVGDRFTLMVTKKIK